MSPECYRARDHQLEKTSMRMPETMGRRRGGRREASATHRAIRVGSRARPYRERHHPDGPVRVHRADARPDLRIHIHMYVCMCVCVYVCMYVRMYV